MRPRTLTSLTAMIILVALAIPVQMSAQTVAQGPTVTVVSPAQVAVSQPLSRGYDDTLESDRRVHFHQPIPRAGTNDRNQDDAQQRDFWPGMDSQFGVWPTATNSAYLATYNLFANGASFTGGQLCAYDRTKMLAGDPTAQGICYTISNDGGYLPSDLDGSTASADGTPGYFLNFETLSSLRMYALAPNFANPGLSTLTQVAPDFSVAAFSMACGGGTCIPQSGTNQQLDSLGDRLMYRLAYRVYADHQSMAVNHSVKAGAGAGVRWYELQAPLGNNAAFLVFQQGTYAPVDSTYRWMGSGAMDSAGNMAIGYSASGSSIHPAIRYAGRLAMDPTGMLRTEVSLIEGTGSQTGGLSRWGDYTAMRIDPSDDCTFWYTNEYLAANGNFNWSTFFGSFKFSGCGVTTPDFMISASPASLTLGVNQQRTSTVTVAAQNGFSSSVGLSVSGCPANATCVLNPVSIANGAGSSMLTVNAGTAAAGTYTLTISGVSGSLSHTATVTLVLTGQTTDFTISATPSSRSVSRGNRTSYTVTVTAVNGFTGTVAFKVSGLPANVTATFSPTSVTGSGNSTMRVSVGRTAGRGTSTLTITGTSGALSHSATAQLVIQ